MFKSKRQELRLTAYELKVGDIIEWEEQLRRIRSIHYPYKDTLEIELANKHGHTICYLAYHQNCYDGHLIKTIRGSSLNKEL